jgi:hypothetical protein
LIPRSSARRRSISNAGFGRFATMAHNLITKAPGKNSLRLKRKMAGWGDDFLASLIAA